MEVTPPSQINTRLAFNSGVAVASITLVALATLALVGSLHHYKGLTFFSFKTSLGLLIPSSLAFILSGSEIYVHIKRKNKELLESLRPFNELLGNPLDHVMTPVQFFEELYIQANKKSNEEKAQWLGKLVTFRTQEMLFKELYLDIDCQEVIGELALDPDKRTKVSRPTVPIDRDIKPLILCFMETYGFIPEDSYFTNKELLVYKDLKGNVIGGSIQGVVVTRAFAKRMISNP